MNTLKDLLTEEQLSQYNAFEYPFNLSILHTALKAKLEEDPEYEVWVPFIYYRMLSKLRSPSSTTLITSPKLLVSNKGRIKSFRQTQPKDLVVTVNKSNPYPNLMITFDKKNEFIRLHRLLACCFVPVKSELGSRHPKDLEVNHIDGDVSNFELSNLEWETSSGNNKHAHAIGLHVSHMGEQDVQSLGVKGIIIQGPFAGYEFLLYGRAEFSLYGFQQANVVSCYKGRLKSHKGCKWVLATEEEKLTLPRTLPPEVLASLKI